MYVDLGDIMSKKTVKLTPDLLKRLVLEEKDKLQKELANASEAKEKAWAGGDNLVNKIDYIKKLGIKEAKLVRLLKTVRKARTAAKSSIMKDIKRG
tara:strand:+ start:187 stop:474 length:288 start_codon:yes stop_codon:yes gene_type:complete